MPALSQHADLTFLSSEDADVINVTHSPYNAVGDSVTDNTNAFQDAVDEAADRSGSVYIPPGRYLFKGQVVLPSNTVMGGEGMGKTTLLIDSTFDLEDSLFTNENTPANRDEYLDENIYVHDFSVDASGRRYEHWLSDPATGAVITNPAVNKTRNTNFLVIGGVFNFVGCRDVMMERIENYGHDGTFVVKFAGCLNPKVFDCTFHDSGRADMSGQALWLTSLNAGRVITDITRGATTTIKIAEWISSFANDGQVYIDGVAGITNIPDGLYTISNCNEPARTFTIAVDTSAQPAFLFKRARASAPTWVSTRGAIIRGCTFKDLVKQALAVIAFDTQVSDCYISNTGESALPIRDSEGVTISNCTIDTTTIKDIVGRASEINNCFDVKWIGNTFRNTAMEGLSFHATGDCQVIGNTFFNCVRDAAATYPYGVLSEDYAHSGHTSTSAQGAGDKGGHNVIADEAIKGGMLSVANFQEWETNGLIIQGNTFTDDRTVPQALYGIVIQRGPSKDDVFNIDIVDNNFRGLTGITSNNLIKFIDPEETVLETYTTRGNLGHASEFPVVLTGSSTATGEVLVQCGFIPSLVVIDASISGSANVRYSKSTIARDRINIVTATLGIGSHTTIDNPFGAGSLTSAVHTVDAWMITDGAGTVLERAKWKNWEVDGVAINVTQSGGSTVRWVATCFP